MTNTDNSPNPQHDPVEHFREILPAVDPAALNGSDRIALLDLLQASMEAAGMM